jgi:hypothetical protein
MAGRLERPERFLGMQSETGWQHMVLQGRLLPRLEATAGGGQRLQQGSLTAGA